MLSTACGLGVTGANAIGSTRGFRMLLRGTAGVWWVTVAAGFGVGAAAVGLVCVNPTSSLISCGKE